MMTALYRYYDGADQLLYVGISDDWQARNYSHSVYAPWYELAQRLTVTLYPSRTEAASAEVEAIRSERPMWNLRDSPLRAEALARHDDVFAKRFDYFAATSDEREQHAARVFEDHYRRHRLRWALERSARYVTTG